MLKLSILACIAACAAASDSDTMGGQLAAAWMFVAETEESWWYDVPFDSIDVLYVGPAGIQQDGKFGVHPSVQEKFGKVIQAARAANPSVKILISQWYGQGQEDTWGQSLFHLSDPDADLEAYASSVGEIMQKYGLDGYDIDYEYDNLIYNFPSLSAALRKELDSTGALFTITPANTRFLTAESLENVNLVNMQSYAGGEDITPSVYTKLGVPSRKILFGICPESSCSGSSAESACSTAKAENLGGIHTWRLNSDNHVSEGSVVQTVFQKLHTGECAADADIVM